MVSVQFPISSTFQGLPRHIGLASHLDMGVAGHIDSVKDAPPQSLISAARDVAHVYAVNEASAKREGLGR